MKTFYCVLFWLCLSVFIGIVYCGETSDIKDFGLPFAALFFSSGTLFLEEKKTLAKNKRYILG